MNQIKKITVKGLKWYIEINKDFQLNRCLKTLRE